MKVLPKYITDPYPNYIPLTEKYGERFCAAPWTSLLVKSNGDVKFCCMTTGDLKEDSSNMNDIVNSSLAKNVRKQFLNGEMAKRANGVREISWQNGQGRNEDSRTDTYCDTCWKLERDTNLPTDNRLSNNQWADNVIDNLIQNTDETGHISKQAPTWLDISFSNKCNFSCIGCDSNTSTSIGKYESAFQLRDGNRDYVNKPFKESDWLQSNVNVEEIINYILEHKDTIEHIHFQGGEPFMMPEVYQTMDRLIEHDLHKPNGIKLWVHTNGSIRKYKGVDIFEKYLSKWQRRFSITMSHDGYGPRGEYIRYGYKDKKWLEIYARLNNYGCKVDIQHSINIFNILHQYECLEWYIDNCVLSLLDDPDALSFTFNPWNGFDCYRYSNVKLVPELFEKASDVLDKCINRSNELGMDNYSQALSRYQSEFRTSDIPDIRDLDKENFILSVNELDKLRGTNFHETFPELKSWWDYCID
jgi:organic radical activating enzyme